MAVSFRGYVDTLKKNGELAVVSRATDLRDVTALVPQSDRALLFYYALHMPWENIWMSAPIYEAAAGRVLTRPACRRRRST
jgi:hypothetical protein